MYLHKMYLLYITPFLVTLAILLGTLVIHVVWVNSRWKVWEWPTALYFVALVDAKTRNDFWHLVINAVIISIFVVLILFALGKLHV